MRNIPENVINQFPAKTADMVRQIQYRFADRFKGLMVKMLDENHLLKIDDRIESPMILDAQLKNPTNSKYVKSWIPSPYRLFQSVTTQKNEIAKNKGTPKERLETTLRNINSDTIKSMLEQLTQAADANQVSLDHLYKVLETSAPIHIGNGYH